MAFALIWSMINRDRFECEDECMTGIVDVGGGTRGIYGAGVFDYCMDKGIRFDYLIGVSAGSANASSYLAGQRGRNLRFYDVYAFRKEYMSLGQLAKSGSYINLDYIYSTLSNSDGEDPLDYDAMMDNPARFEIVATNALTGQPEYFQKSDLTRDGYDCVKASCAVPGACKPYSVNGTPYYDGGVSDPVPYERALAQGCDRLVVILTKPKSVRRTPARDEIVARIIRSQYPQAAQALQAHWKKYNDCVEALLRLEKEGRVCVLAPDDIGGLKTLSQDHEALRALYAKGCEDAKRIETYLS